MSFNRERFLKDYNTARKARSIYRNLTKECFRYETKKYAVLNRVEGTSVMPKNFSTPFDQYGFIKLKQRYAVIDEILEEYLIQMPWIYDKSEKYRELYNSILEPTLMDAKYPHVHWAYHCVIHDMDAEQREQYYKKVVMGTSMQSYNRYRIVEFPKTYHRKWMGIDFLIRKAEDLIKAYGEEHVVEKAQKKKIVFFTGSGISHESGIPTFRDSDGLWEQYPIDMVASTKGWYTDPTFVNEFYNMMREKYTEVDSDGNYNIRPNSAHKNIVRLAGVNEYTGIDDNEIVIITQNVDDLHERAIDEMLYGDFHVSQGTLSTDLNPTKNETNCGCREDCDCGCKDVTDIGGSESDTESESESLPQEPIHPRPDNIKIIHLHGELMKMCADGDKENQEFHVTMPFDGSMLFPTKAIVKDIFKSATGGIAYKRMRPYVVFFGEDVPNMGAAIAEVENCDAFIIIGTSLQVYPAAELLRYVPYGVPIIYIDPNPDIEDTTKVNIIKEKATYGVNMLIRNWSKYVK